MLISTRSRYAFRVLARMTRMMREDKKQPVSLALLSEQEQVSVRYLEQIFGLLRSRGIVKGKRGPGGGYVLGMPPREITLFDVVDVLEADFLPTNHYLLTPIKHRCCCSSRYLQIGYPHTSRWFPAGLLP